MGRNKGSIVLAIIVGLALIGLISYIGDSPVAFLINILMIAVIAAVMFFIVRAVMNRRTGANGTSDEMKKYRKAVKQSKQKYSTQEVKTKPKKSASPKVRTKRRHRPHLTVIDGKKKTIKEKNDRASN